MLVLLSIVGLEVQAQFVGGGGRVAFTQQGDYAKGYNAMVLDRSVLKTSGVLYYTLETATDSATRKMIQMK